MFLIFLTLFHIFLPGNQEMFTKNAKLKSKGLTSSVFLLLNCIFSW